MTSRQDVQKRRVWGERLVRYRASGLTVARFCASERVLINTFYYWAKRVGAGAIAASSSPRRDASPLRGATTRLACGVASSERPTSLVEGDRFDTSVAATIIEAKWHLHMPIYRQQDVFAGSGWTPSRSTLLNIVSQVEFVIEPLIEYMTQRVQQDIGVGLDDTGCRMLLPKTTPAVVPGDAKSQRLVEKIAEARGKGPPL